MAYEPYDSSGTDDDFPPPPQNRISRGGQISGNGRHAAMGSNPYPRMFDETDMEDKIHQLEQEAYISVLRAFKAQADAITWEKEGLITELRRELQLSNEEHRDLLSRVNADETIRSIRDRRQSGGLQPGRHGATKAGHEPVPSSSVTVSRKKQKIAPSLPSQSFGGPSPSFHPQTMVASNQPSSAAKCGPMLGSKGKKHKSMPPGPSSMKMQYPSDPVGRGQLGNHISSSGLVNEPAEVDSYDPLIGRKVRIRWPEDNSFYEAVITKFDPVEGHLLVYDKGSEKETWEWFNLSKMSPEDIQWVGDDPAIPHHGGYGAPGHGLSQLVGKDNNTSAAGRGRGLAKGQSRKEFLPSQNGVTKKGLGSDDIQLLQTDTLIKEVERIFSVSHPDPVEMQKAKNVLKEHEQALTEAIAKLAELSDGDSDEDGGNFLHGQTNRE